MIVWSLLLAGLASVAIFSAGYLFAARQFKGQVAVRERELRIQVDQELENVGLRNEAVRQVSEQRLATLQLQLDATRTELGEARASDSRDRILQDVLVPLLERDRIARELALVSTEGSVGHGLPALLEHLVEVGRGRFKTALLADDSGLAMAANATAQNVDALAGLSSMLLQLAERAPKLGVSPPEAVVLHGASGELLLFRIFNTQTKRFVLMVGTDDPFITPELLQSVVLKLRRMLPD